MIAWLEADSKAIKKDLRIRTFLSHRIIGNQPISDIGRSGKTTPLFPLIVPF